MRFFNSRLDRIEAKLGPTKEMKVHVHKVPLGEARPSEAELKKIKKDAGADILIIVSRD
jgi:hypothetical protein